MRVLALAPVLTLATGCGGGAEDTGLPWPTDPTVDECPDEVVFDPADAPPAAPDPPGTAADGDLSCVAGSVVHDGLDDRCAVADPMSANVADFVTGSPLAGATLSFYYADRVGGTPFLSGETDGAGNLGGQVATCTNYAVSVSGDGLVTTLHHDRVEQPADYVVVELQAVDQDSLATWEAAAGVATSAGAGLVVGRVEDCFGFPLPGVAVSARDEAGQPLAGARYFAGRELDPSAVATGAEGLFVLLDVPEGTAWVDAWADDGSGGLTWLGAARAPVEPGAATWVRVRAGDGDGVVVPSVCSCCPGTGR